MTTQAKPIIALASMSPDDPPHWLADIRASLETEYDLRHYPREGYVTALSNDYVALILVDGDAADWVYWTATAKSNNATRRIPIVLVTSDDAVRHEALTSGADLTFSPDVFRREWRTVLRDHARVSDLALVEQLTCECAEPLPSLAMQGIEQFNRGEYYKQHDSFEELWMQTDGPVRDLYRAILQVGVAYYQIQRGNHRGALKMLLRSVQWLTPLPDVCQGVDVAALRHDSYRVRAALESLSEDQMDEYELSLLKPVKLV